MIFKVEFSTYDPKLINILKKVKGKKPYLVEKALTHFLASQTGNEIINALLKDKDKAAGKIKEKKTSKKEEKTGESILIDTFL